MNINLIIIDFSDYKDEINNLSGFFATQSLFWNNNEYKKSMLKSMGPAIEIVLDRVKLVELNKDNDIFVTYYNTGSNGLGNSPKSKKARSEKMFIKYNQDGMVEGDEYYMPERGVRELAFKNEAKLDGSCIKEIIKHPTCFNSLNNLEVI